MQEKDEIDRNLKDTFNKDGVEFHNELERIMHLEADELIRAKYETREGLKELNDIIKKAVNSNDEKSLLDLTKVHKQIKLKQMEQTMAFTRFCSMVEKIFVETIF
jgi:50S ribosomal subunit-associated GTPase HflX